MNAADVATVRAYACEGTRKAAGMGTAVRSVRGEQRALVAAERARHKSWAEIARLFVERYGVNMRVALRLVRGWSQRDVADQWNARWPDNPRTLKNISYWELWPSPTGHAPSLDVLARLAELYQCSISDLVDDYADFRSADPVVQARQQLATFTGDEAAAPTVEAVVERLEHSNVEELAKLASTWVQSSDDRLSRRSLLLKLSASLTLAASADGSADAAVTPATAAAANILSSSLTGIWLSRYVYPSTGRGKEFVGQHYVVLRQQGNRLTAESLTHTTGSQLRLDLSHDGAVVTGSWRERTSPTGYYKGAVYHGTLQMFVDPAGRRMTGMWLGFGRDFKINSGQWQLIWCEADTSKAAQRAYENKV